jgi:hypothetical protein
MEIVEIRTKDEKAFNAHHEYYVTHYKEEETGASYEVIAEIKFQKGPVKEFGINGCQNEHLIEIVIDRLQGFQTGEFTCRENAIAITKLEEALMWLNKRTSDRIKLGIEGTSQK